MTPGHYDISLYRGDSFQLRALLYHDDERTMPVDLTLAMEKAEWRTHAGGTAILVFDTEITLPNQIDVSLPAAAWDFIPNCGDGGVWDLELTWPGPIVATVLAGRVSVREDVTNRPFITNGTSSRRVLHR